MNVLARWSIGALILLSGLSSLGAENRAEDDIAERVIRSHATFLNEISDRRRLNSIFPNEQSSLYGVPIRYVNSSRGNLQDVDPQWRNTFAGMLESLIARGFGSAPVYGAYAFITPVASKQLQALEQVVRMVPDDAGSAVRLGLAYLNRGRWDEAAEQFRRAKKLAPESQHGELDYYLDLAAKRLRLGGTPPGR